MKDIGQGQSFINFALRNRIYIDKTEQIYELLKNDRVFVSRPRRFGKSLMLDTIGTLFEEGVDPYFKGTWIYKKWTEQKYPVLSLNFLEFNSSDFDEFSQRLNDEISYFASGIGLADYSPRNTPGACLISLFRELDKARRSIVILIDEYDAQLAANLDNEEQYILFQKNIRDLYSVLKGKRSIRFLGVTGVTRLKDVSIFSVGSDIVDASYASEVSTITGFTRAEIRQYYADYIDLAVSLEKGIPAEMVTEEQRNALLDRLAAEYDGYCFDETCLNKVFSTWSVNTFFQSLAKKKYVAFGDYWYDNGGAPSILLNYLKTHTLSIEDFTEERIVTMTEFWNPTSLLEMKQDVLMCQTGYLTVCSPVAGRTFITLGIPNKEVRRCLEKALFLKIFHVTGFNKENTEKFFSEASAGEIVEKLNSLMNTISYEDYHNIGEKFVQGMIHAFFIGADQPVRTEVQNAAGRSDLVLEYENRRVVFELRYAANNAECERQLQDGIVQIKRGRYGDLLPKKDVMQIALVFNGIKGVRQFTNYATVD